MSKPLSNIAWMDVETDGLKTRGGHLLEIACLVTDAELNILDETGYEAVVHYAEPTARLIRERADPFVQQMHDKTGLWVELSRRGKGGAKPLTEIDAELFKYLRQFGRTRTMPLGGNSVRLDFNFVEEFLPKTYGHLDYHMIDVSTVAGLAHRWYPDTERIQKHSDHTAMVDIRESIRELAYYRERVFKPVSETCTGPTEQEVEMFLRGIGLSDEPDKFDSSIHSWRCEHPDRYGRCTCFQEVQRDLTKLIRGENE